MTAVAHPLPSILSLSCPTWWLCLQPGLFSLTVVSSLPSCSGLSLYDFPFSFPGHSSVPRNFHSIINKLFPTFNLLAPFLALTAKWMHSLRNVLPLLNSRKGTTNFPMPPNPWHGKCCWHSPHSSILFPNLFSSTLWQNPLLLRSSSHLSLGTIAREILTTTRS